MNNYIRAELQFLGKKPLKNWSKSAKYLEFLRDMMLLIADESTSYFCYRISESEVEFVIKLEKSGKQFYRYYCFRRSVYTWFMREISESYLVILTEFRNGTTPRKSAGGGVVADFSESKGYLNFLKDSTELAESHGTPCDWTFRIDGSTVYFLLDVPTDFGFLVVLKGFRKFVGRLDDLQIEDHVLELLSNCYEGALEEANKQTIANPKEVSSAADLIILESLYYKFSDDKNEEMLNRLRSVHWRDVIIAKDEVQ